MKQLLFSLTFKQSLLIVLAISVLPATLLVAGTDAGFSRLLAAGRIGAVYLFLAFVLYVFLIAIRIVPRGGGHRKLVTFTRIYIRFHIALAVFGAFLIFWHAGGMVQLASVTFRSVTGIFAVASLIPLLWTGYMRKRKSSGKRRRFHRYAAFLFILLAVIHILL